MEATLYAEYQESAEYFRIRDELIGHLSKCGEPTDCYLDMVNGYMALWTTAKLLEADISDRGISVPTATGFKANDSIDRLIKTNSQMTKLLDFIGVPKTKQVSGGDGL